MSLIAEPNTGKGVVVAEDAILLLVIPLVASSIFGILARRLGFSAVAGYILGGVTSRVDRPQIRANELVESFLYVITLVIVATATLLVSFPLIERTFSGVIGDLGSGVLVAVLIIIFLLLVWRSARRAAQRLEEVFDIR